MQKLDKVALERWRQQEQELRSLLAPSELEAGQGYMTL